MSTAAVVVPKKKSGPYEVRNPIFDITVDGRFSGAVQGGVIAGEWEGIAPLLYRAPESISGILLPALRGDPRANVYAPVGLGEGPLADEIYALFAFVEHTNPDVIAGSFVAEIAFPFLDNRIHLLNGQPSEDSRELMTLQIRADGLGGFTYFVNAGDLEPIPPVDLGIEVAAGFGPSPLSDDPHLVIELEMPLYVPGGFGDLDGNGEMNGDEVFPPEGLNGGYSPLLAQWTVTFANDRGEKVPGVDMLVEFDRLGITTASANHLAPVPEPSSLAIVGLAGLCWGLRRRVDRRRPFSRWMSCSRDAGTTA